MAIIGKMLLFCKASGQAADSSGLCPSLCGEAVLRHPPIPQMFPRLRRPICDEEFLRIEAASYGPIARAIADLALSRSENSPQRFYSMSSRISAERGQYYDVLERTLPPRPRTEPCPYSGFPRPAQMLHRGGQGPVLRRSGKYPSERTPAARSKSRSPRLRGQTHVFQVGWRSAPTRTAMRSTSKAAANTPADPPFGPR
jgi:hypothetical protein